MGERKEISYSEINKLVNKLSEEEFRSLRFINNVYSNKALNQLKENHRKEISQICDQYGYTSDVLAKYEKTCIEALKLAIQDVNSLRYVSKSETNKNIIENMYAHKDELLKFKFKPVMSKVQLETKKEIEEEGESYAVFLSHSQQDKILANMIKKFLREIDVISFVAHDDIEEGEIWEPKIIDGVKNSKILIVLATRDIENSAWVNFETGIGYEKLFPIIFHDLSDKVSYVKSKQGIIVDYSQIEKSILRLAYKVTSKMGIINTKPEETIKSYRTFQELKQYIQENYGI